MGLRRALTLLPLAAALPAARAQVPEDITAPLYTPEQCDGWVGALLASDGDGSAGLSEDEYFAFLQGIPEPPYIAPFFRQYEGFDRLPWIFRVVHKSLACHCAELGMGEKCCEGDDAEVLLTKALLLGQDDSDGDSTAIQRNSLRGSDADDDGEYKDLFCQQIAYVLSRAVPSPAPTSTPSAAPTEASGAPSTPPPVPVTTASPVQGVVAAPPAPTTTTPTAAPTKRAEPVVGGTRGAVGDEDDDSGGLSTWALVLIIAGALIALVLLLLMVAKSRRKEEPRTREFAGEPAAAAAPETETALVPAAAAALAAPSPAAVAEGEKDDDDNSEAPSVWSEGEKGGKGAAAEVVEGHDAPAATAGSALAAMGAASTVAAKLSATDGDGVV